MTPTTFSGFEWLMIDLASRFGLDKELNADRLAWAKEMLQYFKVSTFKELRHNLTPWIMAADEPDAFVGAALAIWDTYKGKKSNWMVSQDSASSGAQLMSLLMKCETGMAHTGTLDNFRVPDLYTDVHRYMGIDEITRKVLKKGMIPHMYASEAAPKAVFEDNYPQFLQAYCKAVPMAQKMSDALVASWNSHATEHTWVMPDGMDVVIPVLVTEERNIPYLKHSYTYRFEEVGTKPKGKAAGTKSLSANGIHSYDAYVLRELCRRCNYDKAQLTHALSALRNPTVIPVDKQKAIKLNQLEKLATQFKQVSLVAVEYIDHGTAACLSDTYRYDLIELVENCLEHESFEVSTVHDDFMCLPNHVNQMKKHYNMLMAETYDSQWGYYLIEKLSGREVQRRVPRPEVRAQILEAEYSIG